MDKNLENVVEEAGKEAVIFVEKMPSKGVVAAVIGGATFVVALAAVGVKHLIDKGKENKGKKLIRLNIFNKKDLDVVSDEELGE